MVYKNYIYTIKLNMNTLKTIYTKTVPFITIYSTIVGINVGLSIDTRIPYSKPFDKYSHLIGYTSLGIITGLTYPISYPAFGYYVLCKNHI